MGRTVVLRIVACDLLAAGTSAWGSAESASATQTAIWLVGASAGLLTLAGYLARRLTVAYPERFTV